LLSGFIRDFLEPRYPFCSIAGHGYATFRLKEYDAPRAKLDGFLNGIFEALAFRERDIYIASDGRLPAGRVRLDYFRDQIPAVSAKAANMIVTVAVTNYEQLRRPQAQRPDMRGVLGVEAYSPACRHLRWRGKEPNNTNHPYSIAVAKIFKLRSGALC